MSELDRAPQVSPDEPATSLSEYVPPQVESVLTSDELAREIQYAGNLSLAG